MMSSWAVAGQVITPTKTLEQGIVAVTDEQIAWVGPAESYSGRAPVLDMGSHVIAPGFIDVHVHGGGGGSLRHPDASGIRRALAFHGRHGTTGLLASIATAPLEQVADTLRVLDRLMVEQQTHPPEETALLGVHLEGPWLNPEKAGGQRTEHIRMPDPAEFNALVGLAPLRWATVAPELPGAETLIRCMKEHGLVVSAGHTAASYAEMQEAVTWGIDHVTHFYNAMRGLHHREPGVVGVGLTLQELYLEVIADGIHVHPGALRLAYQAKGRERLMLVTDAVEYAGMPEGVYEEGDRKLLVEHGSIRMQDGTLAGSTLTMDQAVALMVRQVGVPLEEALAMASFVPAERLRLSDRKGSLAPGKDADLVVLDDHFQVQLTTVRGHIIFQH